MPDDQQHPLPARSGPLDRSRLLDADLPEAGWPSDLWAEHHPTCEQGHLCDHPIAWPDWWVALMTRGLPLHPNPTMALAEAVAIVNRWNGGQPLLNRDKKVLVQKIVIDSLSYAPQPLARSWVRLSLAVVAAEVRWASVTGEALTRDHLMSARTRSRFVNLGLSGMQPGSRDTYRGRLDVIAAALNGVQTVAASHGVQHKRTPTEPLTQAQIGSVWAWARGLAGPQRARRIRAVLVLGLGCGLALSELNDVKGSDVTVDDHGVHVHVTGGSHSRTVTCHWLWEEELTRITAALANLDRLLVTDWASKPVKESTLNNVIRNAQDDNPPTVRFNANALRNTWLVQHLSAGTPVPLLLDAAGLRGAASLEPLFPWVHTPSQPERAALLRRASTDRSAA